MNLLSLLSVLLLRNWSSVGLVRTRRNGWQKAHLLLAPGDVHHLRIKVLSNPIAHPLPCLTLLFPGGMTRDFYSLLREHTRSSSQMIGSVPALFNAVSLY